MPMSVLAPRFWLCRFGWLALVAACVLVASAPAFAGQRVVRSLMVGGQTRTYVVWLPDGAQTRGPLPVVLAFHGGGGQPEALEDNSQLHMAAEARNFIIVYPAGYDRTWNVGGYCCGGAARANVDDLGFVAALLQDLGNVARFDRHRVYATGFSNGAQFSYYLACHRADLIAAIATMAASMVPPYDTCQPSRPVPVMHFAGTADPVAPIGGGKSMIRTAPEQPPVTLGIDTWRKINGTRVTKPIDLVGPAAQCTESSGGPTNAVVILCLVDGMGHQWPGRNQAPGSRRVLAMLGPLGPAFDVNDVILSFFSRYATP